MKAVEIIGTLVNNLELRAVRVWDGLTVKGCGNQLLNVENDVAEHIGCDDEFAVYKEKRETSFTEAFNAWQNENKYIEIWGSNNSRFYKVLGKGDKTLMIPNTIIANGVWYILED